MAALSRTAKAIGSPPRDDSAGRDVSRRGQFPLPVPVHSTADRKAEPEVQEPSARVDRATMSIGSSKPLPSLHSFVRPPRSHSSVPAALSKTPARAAPCQGWRVSATARLVLDGRENDGMLMRHGATQVANATPQSPRGHSHQTPFACSQPPSAFTPVLSSRPPRPPKRPPSALSPFAQLGCYLRWGDVTVS